MSDFGIIDMFNLRTENEKITDIGNVVPDCRGC